MEARHSQISFVVQLSVLNTEEQEGGLGRLSTTVSWVSRWGKAAAAAWGVLSQEQLLVLPTPNLPSPDPLAKTGTSSSGCSSSLLTPKPTFWSHVFT